MTTYTQTSNQIRNKVNKLSKFKFTFFISLISSFLLSSCDNYNPAHFGFSKLEQVQSKGSLTVLTRLGPTTYFLGKDGPAGLEYELVQLFAKHLKVKVKFITAPTFSDLLYQISAGKADIAAAGLTITDQRKKNMRFTPSYQSITEQVVYRSGNKKPKNISDLSTGILEIVKGSSYAGSLEKLQLKTPSLRWNVNTQLNTDGLLYLVNKGLIDYTIADSHQVSTIRRFYPKLNVAFDITTPRELAWAFPLSSDNSLYQEASIFFKKIIQDKTLDHLLEKYYGNSDNLSYVGNCKFRLHIANRLPLYEALFRKEGKKHSIDWRLLAAIGYQESHWNPDATSPTGVKGLMMLTQGTAKQLGISDRTDAAQSISGGALYFKQRLKIIPERIKNPDKTWFALASYNVGFGHLEDARILTQKLHKNPDKWVDVKAALPLLTKKKWYSQTKHGYARGNEPVHYVKNIRSYYDLLIWLTEENQIEKEVMSLQKEQEQKQSRNNKALDFEPPSL